MAIIHLVRCRLHGALVVPVMEKVEMVGGTILAEVLLATLRQVLPELYMGIHLLRKLSNMVAAVAARLPGLSATEPVPDMEVTPLVEMVKMVTVEAELVPVMVGVATAARAAAAAWPSECT